MCFSFEVPVLLQVLGTCSPVSNLFNQGAFLRTEFHRIKAEARPNGSTLPSVCQCKGVFPIIPEDEISFAESAAGHDLEWHRHRRHLSRR